ncbi:MAG: hypothetical protein E1N59_1631 [Puniceicoccaceae bacterium 5H]|nr:MAG: hypothetical protein E1N59_1631 [Puniceicoccaceae bacterium 5H]
MIPQTKTLWLALMAFATMLTGSLQAQQHLSAHDVDSIVAPYLKIQHALTQDDIEQTHQAAKDYLNALQATEGEGNPALRQPAESIAAAQDLAAARQPFATLSHTVAQLVKEVGVSDDQSLYVAHCPMAFSGKGADWVQADQKIANPYFGRKMLHCGAVQEQIAGEGKGKTQGNSMHGHDMDGHHMNHDAMHGSADHAGHMAMSEGGCDGSCCGAKM